MIGIDESAKFGYTTSRGIGLFVLIVYILQKIFFIFLIAFETYWVFSTSVKNRAIKYLKEKGIIKPKYMVNLTYKMKNRVHVSS
jgi:hypothetical protein